MVTLQTIIQELDKLFLLFNDRFYQGALIKPVITIQTNGKHKLTLGWCTTKRIWKDTLSGEFYYEINLSAEFLFRGIFDISETLLHEMVHLYNLQNEVQDCSRKGTYHNKYFRQEAGNHGLICSFSKKYGWSHTELTEETKSFIDSLPINPDDFSLTRLTPGLLAALGLPPGATPDDEVDSSDPILPIKKGNSRKYSCPVCGQSVRATKAVHIICGDCNEKMVHPSE